MDKTIKIAVAVLIIVIIGGTAIFVMPLMKSAPPAISGNAVSDAGKVTVFFFYGEECPHCHNVMPFIQNLSKKYPDVNFQMLETWHNSTNANISTLMNDKLGVPEEKRGVPEIIVIGNNTPLIGDRDIPVQLEGVILEQIKKK
jgi:thiol-disulfide isomerase/thioredoxin